MKNLISFSLLLIALAFSFGSCQSANSTPEGAARGFMDAMTEMDVEEAKKYCSKSMGAMITSAMAMIPADQLPEMKAKAKADAPKIESIECTEDGDKAVCKLCCDENGKSQDLRMAKEDGKWVVNEDKNK